MKAIFQEVKINYILIEEGVKEATVDAVISQNGLPVKTKFFLNQTDLNQLFNKFRGLDVDISLSENFSAFQTENGTLYQLDMKDFGWDTLCVQEIAFNGTVKQIRA